MTTRRELSSDQWKSFPSVGIFYRTLPEEEEWLDPVASPEDEIDFRHSHLSSMLWSYSGHTSRVQSSESTIDVNQLSTKLTLVQQELSICMGLLRGLADAIDQSSDTRITAINSIGNNVSSYLLNRPLFVSIEEDDNEVVASVPELRASGFGSTDGEAIDDLKSILGELYRDLIETPDDKLGRLPLAWRRILVELVETDARASL